MSSTSLRMLLASLALCALGGRAMAFDALDELFGTQGAPLPKGADARTVRQAVRERMTQPAFYSEVLPRLFTFFSQNTPHLIASALGVAKVDGKDVLYRRMPNVDPKRPCDAAHQSTVVPWWDDTISVQVCTSDYHPDVDHGDNPTQYCEAIRDDPASPCACGPHLIYCSPRELRQAMEEAVEQEPLRTMQAIIQRHLPFSQVLTTNETMRSRLLDFHYARALHGNDTQPMHWTAAERSEVAWRSRPAQFGGGIWTTPYGINWELSRRLVAQIAWSDFLCMPLVAARTHAEGLFTLPDSNLRVTGYKPLTLMTGCKECHTRLENGLLALSAFTVRVVGHRYIAAQETHENVAFYGRDSKDRRAEGPATAAWLGKTLTQQPEFAACMATRVEELFFGGAHVAADTHEKLRARFANGLDFAKLIEDVAVVRLVGDQALDEVRASVSP